jgi:Predicted oxidoreductases of the aldo/keto reductase family
MPCPEGINIPTCFATYNDHWVFDGTPAARQRYEILSKIAAPASKCIECGRCESHCPQEIAIRKELKNVKELFE